jgi:uncharacterized protein YuzE
MIKTSYDPEADAFSVWFAPAEVPASETKEVAPGVMLDFDGTGNVIGVEVLSVRLRLDGAYPGTATAAAPSGRRTDGAPEQPTLEDAKP